MLELFPEGFVEQASGKEVELVAFTDEAGAGRLREIFGAVASVPVAPGWEEEWKRFHVPVVVGSLWIGPPWELPAPGLAHVVIDPGLAFGTGAHPTTQLCLEFLDVLEPGSLLDVGCGSGVLAIAASKLGFGPIVAIDSDEAAVEITRQNAAANGVALDVRRLDGLADPLPDAENVVANIDLRTFDAFAPPPGARKLVASGYYEDDRPTFAGFDHAERGTLDKWAADLFTRE